MDAARCARRLGAEVTVVYRRSMEDLPARREEVEHALEEGVRLRTLCAPTVIHGDEQGDVSSMTLIRMELGEPDSSGRRRPMVVPGSEEDAPADCVIMSLGTTPNPLIRSTIARTMGDEVTLVNPAYETAVQLRTLLRSMEMDCDGDQEVRVEEKYQFYVSDMAEKFSSFAGFILPGKVKDTMLIDIEKY